MAANNAYYEGGEGARRWSHEGSSNEIKEEKTECSIAT